ncbi:MAG: patatin-like phospholipase family protein [Peptostreptococcaceae bacterium]|nr:patatin-like phospholipase family protein [Peptostreptococcaceae bacterium]MDY5738444.1 patatin-like phospholipase family protein [Anaerovoracaceae bacterium]
MNKKKVALVFSGGGSRGAYQCGVWQALYEMGIKVDMVVGTSVGSINGAMCAQGDLELANQLWRELETDMLFDVEKEAGYVDFSKEFIRKGGAGTSGLQKRLKKYVDEDKIRNSEIDYGLVVVEFPQMKAHYLWKDEIESGLLHDYITASCSAFPALHSHEIKGKSYIDGGYGDVLPISMARERGADSIIAVYLEAAGIRRSSLGKKAGEDLTVIMPRWDLGNFLVFDTNKARRLLRLGYLDAMKEFGVLDGNLYGFPKGSWDKRTIYRAEMAGKFFALDPTILYRPEYFIEVLGDKVHSMRANVDRLKSFANINSLKALKSFPIQELSSSSVRGLLVLNIIDSFKEKGPDSIYATSKAMRLIGDEIKAARFIMKEVLKNE